MESKKFFKKVKIKLKQAHRYWDQISGYQKGRVLKGVGEMGKEGQLYGDEW